jgi:hypothetical protein
MKFPTSPKTKTRSGLGLERIKIRETAPQTGIIFYFLARARPPLHPVARTDLIEAALRERLATLR